MKKWTTDGSIEADTRYPRIVQLAFRAGAPCWLLNVLTHVFR